MQMLTNNSDKALSLTTIGKIVGVLLVPCLWIIVKQTGLVSDRYLPSPSAVLSACFEVQPSVFYHFAVTALRLVVGFISGVAAGIALGIVINRSKLAESLLTPTLNTMRSVPAIAVVPFFLLWFGFSETGKILLVITGIAFNIAVATKQALDEMPDKHKILFNSFNINPSDLVFDYTLPRLLETLLPTVRFSLSTAMGVVIVSELLGSQIGLGYLMQTARSTFSMHVIFLATLMLGVLNVAVDACLKKLWTRAVFWV